MQEFARNRFDLDPVDAASAESFPASDPPGWAIGQSYPVEPIEVAPADGTAGSAGADGQNGEAAPAPPSPSRTS